MALILTVSYLLLTFLSVADTFPDLAPYRIQLILGILGAGFTGIALLMRGGVRLQKQDILMTCFTASVVLSWLPHRWFGGTLYALQSFMPLGIVFFLTALNLGSIKALKIVRVCLLGLAVYLVAHGLAGYFLSPDDSKFVMIQHEGAVTLARLQAEGILADPNAYAQFLLALLPLLLLGFKERGWFVRFTVILPVAGLLLTGIYSTHSRGGLIGLAVLIGVAVWRRMRFAAGGLASAAIAAALLAIGYTGGRSMSVAGGMDRLDVWSDGLGLFKGSPIWGIGYNQFPNVLRITAHNSFLLCAAELGLIGFFFWMALLLTSGWQLHSIAAAESSEPELRAWANAILLSLVGFLAPGFFLSETYAPMLYLLLGMATALTRLSKENAADSGAAPEVNYWALKTALACCSALVLIYVMVRLRAV
ncbi:MAG TPA: O-antigen ligase family protein [Bryobacteraceae bacterium]|nr:O-antigen ligase family protein [Bryobacteraceae bacterium]